MKLSGLKQKRPRVAKLRRRRNTLYLENEIEMIDTKADMPGCVGEKKKNSE